MRESQILEPKGTIDLETASNIKHSIFDNVFALSSKDHFLAICIDSKIVIINLNTRSILLNHMIVNTQNSLKYFLSPTNLTASSFICIQSIPDTDSFIALDNLNNLNYIEYDSKRNSVRIITDEDFYIDSFKIERNILMTYDKRANQFFCFDLHRFATKSIKKPFKSIFHQKYGKDIRIELFGLSEDAKNVFIVSNNGKLAFFSLKTCKKTSEIILYSMALCITCSKEYICIGMQDRRVISYLIYDPESSQSRASVKKLMDK